MFQYMYAEHVKRLSEYIKYSIQFLSVLLSEEFNRFDVPVIHKDSD